MELSSTAFDDSFGDRLRGERERRGLTLEQVSVATKVGRNHLQALEEGDYDALPHGIFRRGIVRAYLSTAGLEEETWMPLFLASLARYLQAHGETGHAPEAAWEEFADNVRSTRPKRPERRHLRWLGVFALFALVLAAAWALWHFSLRALPKV